MGRRKREPFLKRPLLNLGFGKLGKVGPNNLEWKGINLECPSWKPLALWLRITFLPSKNSQKEVN